LVQCSECGSFDTMGLGFCTICGKNLPKPGSEEAKPKNEVGPVGEDMEHLDMEETKSRVLTGLVMIVMMSLFLFIYLVMNDTDPVLIIMVEAFPILWFLLILMQWRLIKGKSGN